MFVRLISATPAPVHKLLHIVAYALLAFLCMWHFAAMDPAWLRATLVFAITVAMGAGLEWYQVSVAGRYGTMIDVVLNAIGSALGLLAAMALL